MAALPSLDGGSTSTESLKQTPKFIMEDVERFISSEKAPWSGLTKGYKFFCEGFIDNYEGICPVIGPECVTAVSKITESVFCNSFHWPPNTESVSPKSVQNKLKTHLMVQTRPILLIL